MTVYYLYYYGDSGNGIVSTDNESCNSLDFVMTFKTELEVKKAKEELQKEWTSLLTVASYEL